ncbi:ribokinase [Persicobacter diffluens]|uniref:Ribokinase n=1 Tax=Persicobacter diffluens TaxID=981 RepID=A0AAN5AM57_9BACT|nr:ribokinase [Persicobacter diffluens]
MKNILVIGSSNVDLVMKMPRLPQVGETVTNANFHQYFGGKGANQAVAAARSGGEVTFITAVGKQDNYTAEMISNFENDQINCDHVEYIDGVNSGCAFVMVGEEGHNYLAVDSGSNQKLAPTAVSKNEALIHDASVVVLQNEIPEQTNELIISEAVAHKTPIVWNYAPAIPKDKKIFQGIDYLIVNEVEAAFITEIAEISPENAQQAMMALLKLGVKCAIITMGGDGVAYANAEGAGFVPANKVKVEDTTAAGDTFCGCFAKAIVDGTSIPEAIVFANAAAGITVQRLGAQSSIPTQQEIEDFSHKPESF